MIFIRPCIIAREYIAENSRITSFFKGVDFLSAEGRRLFSSILDTWSRRGIIW
jgi:hypothetical protein